MEGGKSVAAGANFQRISLEDPSLRRQKYKRSTNNSHKKFICVARRLFFRLCTHRERELFEIEYQTHQNSRVYYFIILSHVKLRMRNEERENFKNNLTSLLEAKVASYSQEIKTTSYKNFINFRFEEIADIQFALRALGLYLQDRVQEAIEVIYKKEKGFVLKRQQYQMALTTIKDLEKRLRQYPPGQLLPYINDKMRKGVVKEKKTKQADDQEWMQSKEGKDKIKLFVKKEKPKEPIIYREEHNNYPLICLENSFPIYNSFYQVLFNYNSPVPSFFPHYLNLQNHFSSSIQNQQPNFYSYKQDIQNQSYKSFIDPKKKHIQTTVQTVSRPIELVHQNDYP